MGFGNLFVCQRVWCPSGLAPLASRVASAMRAETSSGDGPFAKVRGFTLVETKGPRRSLPRVRQCRGVKRHEKCPGGFELMTKELTASAPSAMKTMVVPPPNVSLRGNRWVGGTPKQKPRVPHCQERPGSRTLPSCAPICVVNLSRILRPGWERLFEPRHREASQVECGHLGHFLFCNPVCTVQLVTGLGSSPSV